MSLYVSNYALEDKPFIEDLGVCVKIEKQKKATVYLKKYLEIQTSGLFVAHHSFYLCLQLMRKVFIFNMVCVWESHKVQVLQGAIALPRTHG